MKIITPPTYEPLTVQEVANYLRVDDLAEETTLLGMLITAARQNVEQYLNKFIATQTVEFAFDTFEDTFELTSPLQSVESIKYLDRNNVEQTLASNQYLVNSYEEPATITPAFGVAYPDTYEVSNAVKIRCVVGYTTGDSPDDFPMPEPIKFAMLLTIGDLYANREGVGDKNYNINPTVQNLLHFYRIKIGV